MNKTIALAAAAALALSAAPALAQTTAPTSPEPSTTEPATSAPPASTPAEATSATSATAAGANASVTSGMSVKDNTGATIGQVTEVKTDAAGKKTATIKMGADTFAVDTGVLAVTGDAATVNATQAEIKTMLGKTKK